MVDNEESCTSALGGVSRLNVCSAELDEEGGCHIASGDLIEVRSSASV